MQDPMHCNDDGPHGGEEGEGGVVIKVEVKEEVEIKMEATPTPIKPGCTWSPEEAAAMVQQEQLRFLHMRHAHKCQHNSKGECPKGLSCCGFLKQLYSHILTCGDGACAFPHCAVTRITLWHYSRCKKETCHVCKPLRDAIKEENARALAKRVRQEKKERRRFERAAAAAEAAAAMVEAVARTEEEEEDADAFADFLISNAPPSLICPISLTLYQEPLLASDGQCYDKSCLMAWIGVCRDNGHNYVSPVTGERLRPVFLPNYHIKAQLEMYVARKMEEWEEMRREWWWAVVQEGMMRVEEEERYWWGEEIR
jgi:hypothetical protein